MKLTVISHVLCPYVQRVVIALKEKGAVFERIDIDLGNKPDWFLAISPLGKTPVLKAGEKTIFESAVICEYLEDTLTPPLHPIDPLDRAQHRAWIEFSTTILNSIWAFYSARDITAYEASAALLKERFVQLEQALGDGPYFVGEHFSLVDAAFGPVFRYFDVFDSVSDITLFDATPKVRAWRQALSERASVRDAVVSDYPQRLAQFVISQGGMLGMHLAEKR